MFESDFDANDVQDSDDIEFLDTSDTENDVDVEVDDGFYHATHMSAEEVERIDEMWSDEADIPPDNEPYRASRNQKAFWTQMLLNHIGQQGNRILRTLQVT